ncbi:MAG: PAS domain S-box protein [Arcobacteraceae bacterium]
MKLNLKTKLFYILFLPLLFIFFMFAIIVFNMVENRQNLNKTKNYLFEAQYLSSVIHYIQIERGVSVHYSSFKTKEIQEILKSSREELDLLLQKSINKQLLLYQDILNYEKKLKNYRDNIDLDKMSQLEIVEAYTKLIYELQKEIKVIPFLTSDNDNSRYIQAYNFLLNKKESLGKLRALVINGIFHSFSEKNRDRIFYIQEEFYKNKDDFELLIPKDFLLVYEKHLQKKEIEKTLEIVQDIIQNKNITMDSNEWFKTATGAIDMLFQIEKEIFEKVNNSILAKIESTNKRLYALSIFFLLTISIIIILIIFLFKKIIDSTNQLEDSYEESKQLLKQYKGTVDKSFIVSKTDAKGVITYANNEFCKISGYSQEELLGKSHNIVRHPDVPKEVFQEMWHTIKELKQPWIGKVKNRRKDGSAYWVQAIINPILDSKGNVLEHIAVRSDITEIETTKEYLREQFNINKESFNDILMLSKLYENAIEQSNLILRLSLDRKITYVNKLFCQKSGYTKEELIGKDYGFIQRPSEINDEDVEKLWVEIKKDKIYRGQIVNINKKGEKYYSLATVVPIKNSKGKTLEYMSIRKDITEVFNLHSQLGAVQQDIIYKMGEITETRSKETGNHVKRVAYYSRLLGELYGLSVKEIEILFAASPMHDIGKIGISDAILNKPGKLTIEEFETMKQHTLVGHNILKDSSGEVFQAASTIAKEHHERFDGSGYPFGLKDKEIHIFGRITAIADVFDALGHDRVYKKAWKMEDILELFKEERGKHFDPELIDLFFKNIDQFIEIKKSLEDT